MVNKRFVRPENVSGCTLRFGGVGWRLTSHFSAVQKRQKTRHHKGQGSNPQNRFNDHFKRKTSSSVPSFLKGFSSFVFGGVKKIRLSKLLTGPVHWTPCWAGPWVKCWNSIDFAYVSRAGAGVDALENYIIHFWSLFLERGLTQSCKPRIHHWVSVFWL